MTAKTYKTMVKAKIINIKRDIYQATQEPFLDVEVEILENDEVVDTKKFAYAPDKTEEEIVADLENMLITYKSDKEIGEKSKATMELNAKADETAKAIDGLEVAIEEE